MAFVQFAFKFTCPDNRRGSSRSRVNSSTAALTASGGSAGFNRSNAARNQETNTKLRTLHPACRPPFSRLLSHWERQG